MGARSKAASQGSGATRKASSGNNKDNVTKLPTRGGSASDFPRLDQETLQKMHDCMVKSRILEERLIRMFKQSHGYFWIGGPGEEAFNIPLGFQIRKGQGLDHDYLHLHYRSGGILTAMGADPRNALRQMKNTATDPYSGGRNFSNHFSIHEWNVPPVTSTIETQYAVAIGTGLAQKRHGGQGVTIVNGGDAGSAEGEFASCLIWASRPGKELPILIIVMNNDWGISTARETQWGVKNLAERAGPYGIRHRTINGNDVEESWFAIKDALDYIREERKPFCLEAKVSRLYGHSSATGANMIAGLEDPIKTFEHQLEDSGVMNRNEMDEIWKLHNAEIREMAKEVVQEPLPEGDSIYNYIYKDQTGRIL